MITPKHLGCALFAIGVSVAVCAAAKLPEAPKSDTQPVSSGAAPTSEPTAAETAVPAASQRSLRERFPDTLPVFAGAALVAIAGLVLWRLGTDGSADSPDAKQAAADPADPLNILAALQQPLGELEAKLDRLPLDALLPALDDLQDRFVIPFTLARQGVSDRLGMSAGAEVLVTAAVGERMLNRAWSAAADGYLPEARASVREALHAFREAARLAKEKT